LASLFPAIVNFVFKATTRIMGGRRILRFNWQFTPICFLGPPPLADARAYKDPLTPNQIAKFI
jgi:hypothetical protein